jgi:mannose-6-phosphate isomerase class I
MPWPTRSAISEETANRIRVMLHLAETQRVYYPETLAAMAAAFDKVCQWAKWVNSDDEARRQLSIVIIQYVDQGEYDPEWLAKFALCEMIIIRAGSPHAACSGVSIPSHRSPPHGNAPRQDLCYGARA